MKRFVFGLTLMASSMISIAILLAGCIVSPISDSALGNGFFVALQQKNLVSAFAILMVLLCVGTLIALLPLRSK